MNNSIANELLTILDTMDVPKLRKELAKDDGTANMSNLLWLSRNLFIRNGKNPNFPAAKHFINHLLRECPGYVEITYG